MAVDKTLEPFEVQAEGNPEESQIKVEIVNPDAVAVETDDGGVIIDFDPNAQEMGDISFDSNLAEVIDDNELNSLGKELIEAYTGDKESRADWEETYTKGLDQLGLKFEDRTEPWAGACGVFHPM